VEPATVSPFAAWDSFYVIIGSSAAALTGLQFVVIALAREGRTVRGPELGAFGTPTIVHFCAVLLISAILCVPWQALSSAVLALSSCGVAGVGYMLIVVKRTRWQGVYAPVLEDWLWHCVFPFIAYAVLLVTALALPRYPTRGPLVIGATALLLLFSGIHNAWDAAIYIAIQQSGSKAGHPDRD
jgi:hypothetical protein